MSAETPMLEMAEVLLDVGGESLHACMQCGTCTGVCPWGLVDEMSPRWLIRMAGLGLEGYETETLWRCVTCNRCVSRCPREVDLVDVIRSARSVMQEGGMVPREYRGPLGGLRAEGNPWEGKREDRLNWMGDLDVPVYDRESESLFSPCCTHAYDAQFQKVVRKMTSLLLRGGVRFGVIGAEESCCGDQAHKTGALDTFTMLADQNSAMYDKHGVTEVITTSPHCMNVINRELESGPHAEHVTQVFDRLIERGVLSPTREVALTVAYHDPCYLGRHQGVYEPPRRVLQSIPGLRYVELPRNREKSLCCGGGGGGLWREAPTEERFSVLRVREALDAGAEVIATACPYCTIMLQDGINALGIDEERLKILDVAELLYESVE